MRTTIALLAVAGLLGVADLSCGRKHEQVKDPHMTEVETLLGDLAAMAMNPDDEAAVERYHVAKKRLVEIITETDVPLLASKVRAGTYEDQGKGVPGRGGWGPVIAVSEREERRLAGQESLAHDCAALLRDHYLKTNSPQVRDVFLDILRRDDRWQMDALRSALGFAEKIGQPSMAKTDWEEAIHREYRRFERLEASIDATTWLYIEGKYKDEAVWFLCQVLADDTKVCSSDEIKEIQFLHGYRWTPRECAVIHAYQALNALTFNSRDLDLVRKYAIPWARYLHEHGTLETREFGPEYRKEGFLYPQPGMRLDTRGIPAGRPVPPRPPTAAPWQ